MPGFTTVFGGSTVQPAQVSYQAIALSANLQLVWAPQAPTGSTVASRIMDVTASAGSLGITMPPANQQSVGWDTLITNKGSNTFTLYDNSGVVIASISAGQQYYVLMTGNSNTEGTWESSLFGAASSSLTASAVAGVGTIAIGSTLSPNFVSSIANSTPLNVSATSDRAKMYVWTGGAGIANLPAISSLPTPLGFFFVLTNKGTGTLTVTPNGSDTVDGNSSEALNPGYSAMYFASAAGTWYSFGFLSSTQFNFSELVQTVTGGTLTLTQAQAANVCQKYQGTLTSNQIVVLPPTVQVYYVQNATSGAFNLTFKCGTGSTITVPSGSNMILFADGTNVINASNALGSGITSLQLNSGSAGSPSLSFVVDVTTGLYMPSSGNLGLSVSGVQRVNFGANTTTYYAPSSGATVQMNGVAGGPTEQITVPSNTTAIQISDAFCNSFWYTDGTSSSAGNATIGTGTNHALYLSTNNTSRAQISNAGNWTLYSVASGTTMTVNGNLVGDMLECVVGGAMNNDIVALTGISANTTTRLFLGNNVAGNGSVLDYQRATGNTVLGRTTSSTGSVTALATFAPTGGLTLPAPTGGVSALALTAEINQTGLAVTGATGGSALAISGAGGSAYPDINIFGPESDVTIRMNNTTAGGREWDILSSGTGSGLAAGTFSIYDRTANAQRLWLTGTGTVTVNAASSGNSLVVNGNSSSTALSIVGTVGAFALSASGGAYTPTVGLTYGTTTTLDCSTSNCFRVVLTGNITTFTISNALSGQIINVRFKQDGSGSRTISWPSSFRWAGGVTPVLSTAPSAEDFLSAQYDSTDATWVASLIKGVQ